MNITDYMAHVGQDARTASRSLNRADSAQKNQALEHIAELIIKNATALKSANVQDCLAGEEKGLDAALLDRLELNDQRVNAMAEGVAQIATLADPVGSISDMKFLPSGIQRGLMRVPLGVVGIIYESRPNVTADAAALCLKSGNAAVLRGGSEAIHSNMAIATCIRQGLKAAGLTEKAVQVIETTDRAAVGAMLKSDAFIDVIIPRGGKRLIERVTQESIIPVIKHLDGICHVYIDDEADINQAIAIADNAKTHRYGVCNAMETLLVADSVAAHFLPQIASIYHEKGVEIRGCLRTQALLRDCKEATEDDWETEYLAPIIAIKIVDDMEAAIEHINHYSSQHTDAIVTQSITKARTFMREVDSSSVMVNASTRFADGFEYGLGAEIGISTDKLHVRGPVGLEGLTSQKYVVFGDGHIRL